MDARPHPSKSDGEFPGVEQVRSSHSSWEAGLQHPESLQALLSGAETRTVPVHLQRVPTDVPLDQERIRAWLLQMSATNQKSSHQPVKILNLRYK